MALYEGPSDDKEEVTPSDRKMSEKEVNKWKSLLRVAEKYQKKRGNFAAAANTNEGRWDVNVKALDGDFNSKAELGDEAVDVNVTHATIQTLLSPLWTTVPYITVRPTTAKYQDGDEVADNILRAQLTEYEINYWINHLKVNQVNKKCVLDDAATNTGYAYVGYISKTADFKNDDGEYTENEPTVQFKAPFVKRICPKNVLVPPGYYELEECPWVAIGWLKCCEDVCDRYELEDLKADVMGMSQDDMRDMDLTPGMQDYLSSDEAGYVMLWQVWDKRTKKLITLTMSHEDALDVEDWPYDLDGFPLVKQRFTMTPDQQYGMPMMSAWLPQQKELNAARTVTRQRESRIKGVIFMDASVPSGTEDEYKKAPDGAIIRVQTDDGKMSDKMMPFLGLPPSQNAYAYGSTQIQDLMLISGLGQQQRGQGDPNIGSATASALVDKWAQIRQTDMGDTVRTFYLEIARKLWMILKEFPDTKRDMLVMLSLIHI